MIEFKNTRKQGDAGLGMAIAWFTSQGHTVSVPLTDNQKYDLIVEKDGHLNKVEIKTTRYKREEKYTVMLKTCGGNMTGAGKSKRFDKSKVDILFILTADGDIYEIPTTEDLPGGTLTLGKKYNDFKKILGVS